MSEKTRIKTQTEHLADLGLGLALDEGSDGVAENIDHGTLVQIVCRRERLKEQRDVLLELVSEFLVKLLEVVHLALCHKARRLARVLLVVLAELLDHVQRAARHLQRKSLVALVLNHCFQHAFRESKTKKMSECEK